MMMLAQTTAREPLSITGERMRSRPGAQNELSAAEAQAIDHARKTKLRDNIRRLLIAKNWKAEYLFAQVGHCSRGIFQFCDGINTQTLDRVAALLGVTRNDLFA